MHHTHWGGILSYDLWGGVRHTTKELFLPKSLCIFIWRFIDPQIGARKFIASILFLRRSEYILFDSPEGAELVVSDSSHSSAR